MENTRHSRLRECHLTSTQSACSTLLLHHLFHSLFRELEGIADTLDHESICDMEVDSLVLWIEDLQMKHSSRIDLTTQKRDSAFHGFNAVRLNGLKEGLKLLPLFGEERCAANGVERGA